MHPHRNASQRGFTLAEIAVASAIFLFVALVAYTAMTEGTNVYRRGDMQAEMQQRTRLAFDQMMTELRLAGFDYNRDGEENEYPDQPDEQIEYLGAHAIAFRGNFDFGDGNGGREPSYEIGPADPDFGEVCCPIVTVGNDEIVTYALRSSSSTMNTGIIRFSADKSMPRDGGWDAASRPSNEEDIQITNVDLTGANPPYSLMRFSFADDGSLVERVLATDVYALTFTYEGEDGLDTYCLNPNADGTCPAGSSLAFSAVGGLNDVSFQDQKRRSARAAVRRFSVDFTGMTDRNIRNYNDGTSSLPKRPKLALEGSVIPQNLGLRGRPDLVDEEGNSPTNVSVCGGQCNTIRIEWDEVDRATGYLVKLFTSASPEPFFTGSTPGVAVQDSDPARVFAVYQRPDAATIVNGATIWAVVQARFVGDKLSDNSFPSTAVTLSDVVRTSAPLHVQATGYDTADPRWPDVSMNLQPPNTTAGTANAAQPNQVTVTWNAPSWALNVTNAADPATSWTTALSGGNAPLACDKQPADINGDGTMDGDRTRLRENFGTVRYLVFRSTNPRFIPTNADFIGSTAGEVDPSTGRIGFRDRTKHVFTNGIFNRTESVLQNCTTYYYRVRAVDDCWSGSNPASLTDPHISPFAPPLNPSPSATNSDDTTAMSPSDIGPAIPGFAVPKSQPKAPTGLRFNGYDRRTDDGDGMDATIAFEAVKLDNALAPDGTTPAYEDIALKEYRVYSSPSTPSFTLSDIKNLTNGVRLDRTIQLADLKAGRISRDDENNDGTITAAEDEAEQNPYEPASLQPRSGLRVELDATSRYYKVVAVQCTAEDTVPSTSTPDAYDFGQPSAAIKFPCDFGGGQYSTITINSSSFPTSVTSTATLENPAVTCPRTRLVLKDRATGDRAVTAMPGKVPTLLSAGSYTVTFNSAEIAALTDNFGAGNYLISVEWDDSNGCLGVSDSDTQQLSPPSCCLSAITPTMVRVTTTDVNNNVYISCGAAALRITSFSLSVTGGSNPAAKFVNVVWDDPDAVDDRTWTTNSSSPTFDTSSDPPVLSAGQTGTLRMRFSRSVVGRTVTVTYTYKIGGTTGSCTFTQVIP